MRHFKLSDYAEMIHEMAPEIYHQSFENLELISLPNLKRIVWIDEPDNTEQFGYMQALSDWLNTGDANHPRQVAERQQKN